MVKRTVERGCPEQRSKKRRQTGEESGKLHAIRSYTDDAAVRQVQDFLDAIFPDVPGVLHDTTNCQVLAEVPTQAWCACRSMYNISEDHTPLRQHMLSCGSVCAGVRKVPSCGVVIC